MFELDRGIGVALGFLVGIVAHEYVQHRTAFTLGDKTPKLMGRMTLSPKAHIDPLGTLILPGIWVLSVVFSNGLYPMFGWGKRHALNPSMMRHPSKNVVTTALSGPATNLIIAVVAGRVAGSQIDLTGRLGGSISTLGIIAAFIAIVNLYLALIEILPIPGRDGARILSRFLSPSAASKIDDLAQYEILFMLVLFLFLGPIVNGMAEAACGPLFGWDAIIAGFSC